MSNKILLCLSASFIVCAAATLKAQNPSPGFSAGALVGYGHGSGKAEITANNKNFLDQKTSKGGFVGEVYVAYTSLHGPNDTAFFLCPLLSLGYNANTLSVEKPAPSNHLTNKGQLKTGLRGLLAVRFGLTSMDLGCTPFLSLGFAFQQFKLGKSIKRKNGPELGNESHKKWKPGFHLGAGVQKDFNNCYVALEYGWEKFGKIEQDINFTPTIKGKIASSYAQHQVMVRVGVPF